MYYLNNFFFFSLLGYLLEISINIVSNNKIESGFLNIPLTPIYGIGIVIIIKINKILDTNNIKKNLKIVLTFIINTIILTLIEYIGGITLEKIFHKSFWNYSSLPFHIGKYISVEISIIWGLSSLIYIYFIKKLSDKIIYLTPKWFSYILLIITIIDIIITQII